MMNDMGDMIGGMALMMGVATAVVVALVTVGIVATVRLMRRAARSPLEQLDRRYARGDLTTEEYRQRRAAITGELWPAPDWPA